MAQLGLVGALEFVSDPSNMIPFERTPGTGVFVWEYSGSPRPGANPDLVPFLVLVAISEHQVLLDELRERALDTEHK